VRSRRDNGVILWRYDWLTTWPEKSRQLRIKKDCFIALFSGEGDAGRVIRMGAVDRLVLKAGHAPVASRRICCVSRSHSMRPRTTEPSMRYRTRQPASCCTMLSWSGSALCCAVWRWTRSAIVHCGRASWRRSRAASSTPAGSVICGSLQFTAPTSHWPHWPWPTSTAGWRNAPARRPILSRTCWRSSSDSAAWQWKRCVLASAFRFVHLPTSFCVVYLTKKSLLPFSF